MSPYLVHLRLPFQVLLSPIFLWGYLLAGGRASLALAVAYVSLHLFGYAGGTAFNSVFDKDEGPVGGISAPPPVPKRLLAFSLAWQLAGFLLATVVNVPFAIIYGLMFTLSLAYSHPRTRWKGKPLRALFTVAAGQGVLACLGGWSSARGEVLSALSPLGVAAVGGATLITTGFYPLTEIYQMDEDLRRGDRTLAIWLGPRRAFRFALALIGAGALLALAVIAARFGVVEALLLCAFMLVLMSLVRRWGARFDPGEVMYNFRTTMRLYALTSMAFLSWIGWHLLT